MHVSLDGLVAGPNGELNWVHIDQPIFDYVLTRTKAAEIALYGRKTYEIMEAYWPTAAQKPNATKYDHEFSSWYNKVAKIVLSNTLKGSVLPHTTIISDQSTGTIEEIKQSGDGEIIIFGSPSTTQSLLEARLVDDFWLFINPVILGIGMPFFKPGGIFTRLRLRHEVVFDSGVVCLHYERRS